MIFSFFLTAFIYILLSQEFIAVIQVLVYAGAIMVLFIFIIMLLNLGKQEKIARWNTACLAGLLLVIALAVAIIKVVLNWDYSKVAKGSYTSKLILEKGSIELLSETLFHEYILAFEFIAILLLVAAIGAFMLVKEKKKI